MKSKIITAVSVLMFSVCFIAGAETVNDNRDNLASKKEEVKAKIEQMQEKVQRDEEKKEEKVSLIKSLISRFKKTEVENLKTKTLKNFEVAIKNLENLSKRVGSRIEKSDTQGKDVTEAKSFLDKANIQILEAKDQYKKLSDIIPDLFDKNSKKESKDAVKEQTKITKETAKLAHSSLVQAISALKGEEENIEDLNASSTIENLNQDE